MDDYIKAVTVSDIPPGSIKTVVLSGRKLSIANVDGEFFAIDDACSHAQCSLGTEGFIDGTVVTCGCHGATFDVTSGKVMSLPATTGIATYQTKVEGNNVFVKISP